MALLLLFVIYIAFIGLGIPDSLFGPAWPAIYSEFNLPASYGSFVTCTVTFGTIISALFAAKIINKVGTPKVVIVSTFMTVVGLLGYHFSPRLIFMVLSAIPLGLGAGCIDTALNNYVALHYKNIQMNFLHCFYGIGVSLSPYLVSMALANDTWRKGYLYAFFIQLGIALILLASYPLWKRVKANNPQEEEKMEAVSFKKLFTLPMAIIAALVFFTYCGIEVTSGVWSATYLYEVKGFDPSKAALLVTLFYGGLAVGRFISGIISIWVGKRVLIISGILILFAGIMSIMLSNIMVLSAIALFLIGMGCGPIFPNLMSLTPNYYGVKYSQSIVGFEMAFAYMGCILFNPLFGFTAQAVGFELFPYYLLGLFIVFAVLFTVLMVLYHKRTTKNAILVK